MLIQLTSVHPSRRVILHGVLELLNVYYENRGGYREVLEEIGQYILCCRFFGVSSIDPTSIMQRGFRKNSFNQFKHSSLKKDFDDGCTWKKEVHPSTYSKHKIHQTHHPLLLKTKHNFHPRTNSPLHYLHKDFALSILRSVGKDCRETFGMPIPDDLLTNEIKRAPYYGKYLVHVTKYQQYLNEEHGKAKERGVTESPKATKVTKPKAAKQTKPSTPKEPKHTSSQPPTSTPSQAKPSKKDQGKKHKLAKETSEAPSPAKRTKPGKVTKKRMPKGPLQLVDEFVDEGNVESSFIDAELTTTNSVMKSDEEVVEINDGDQDEGQARPNPSEHDEGQAGSNLGDAAKS
uniref:Histone deacetylase 14 n=1 Tax=Tanacetum cinerariifolium TaxID=118510 RepID=A0A699K6R9_TANCI|nr:hypothetical protein [Tanacetum cinerariifolium]